MKAGSNPVHLDLVLAIQSLKDPWLTLNSAKVFFAGGHDTTASILTVSHISPVDRIHLFGDAKGRFSSPSMSSQSILKFWRE